MMNQQAQIESNSKQQPGDPKVERTKFEDGQIVDQLTVERKISINQKQK